MSYVKQNWENGDVITAEKLNHMEDGIADGGVLVVNATVNNHIATLDRTWQEIHDANLAVMRFVMSENSKMIMICSYAEKLTDSDYQATFCQASESPDETVFDTTSADGYPTASI